jgi:NTE family protein
MAKALIEAGHHPDMLYGTSAGALNASSLAADPSLDGVARLAELWTAVKRHDVFPVRPWVLLPGLAGLKDHTFSARAFARWLRATTVLHRLEDGVLPLTVVATDVETGEEVLLDRGPIVPALLASSAMPGIYPPVRIGGRWLVDGSVASDAPIGPAVRAGATRVWVLPSVPVVPMARPTTALDVLLRSTAIVLARHNAGIVAAWCGRCELYVPPAPLVPGVSPFNFRASAQLIEAAYRLTASWLEQARPVEPGDLAASWPTGTPAGEDGGAGIGRPVEVP